MILETFGNAETVRSYNSSRFGKYVEVTLSAGLVVGSTITSYLLEKTRVVSQSLDERNYHSFYQLMCGHAEALAEAPRLEEGCDAEAAAAASFDFAKYIPAPDQVESFKFISNGMRKVPGVDDGADLTGLLKALRIFMPESTIRQALRLLVAILHIGALPVIEDPNGQPTVTGPSATIEDGPELEAVAALLGVEKETITFALCNRQIQTGSRASIAVKQLGEAPVRSLLRGLSSACA